MCEEPAGRPAALHTTTPAEDNLPSRPLVSARPTPPPDALTDILIKIAPIYLFALVLVLMISTVVFVAAAQPARLTNMAASLSGPEPKAYWYLSRAGGLVALGLLWLSMALGLAITNKLARAWPGGPTISALHDYASLLGLAFAIAHALILTGDRYTDYTLAQVLIPFASVNYRPLWVGLGQLGLYVMALVVLSFYVRRWIGYRRWRAIHYLSFGVFLLALLHGLLSGTDSTATWVRDFYWASAISMVGLTLYRVTVTRQTPSSDSQLSSN